MAEAYYEPTPATDGATMNPVPGAVFSVYELTDTAFATPLSLRVGSGNPTTSVTASATLATLPGVYVTSPNFEHVWKSGTFQWRRDSIDGAKKAVEDARDAATAVKSLAESGALNGAPGTQGPEGPRGLPGLNAVENDAAFASALSATGTQTRAALNATPPAQRSRRESMVERALMGAGGWTIKRRNVDEYRLTRDIGGGLYADHTLRRSQMDTTPGPATGPGGITRALALADIGNGVPMLPGFMSDAVYGGTGWTNVSLYFNGTIPDFTEGVDAVEVTVNTTAGSGTVTVVGDALTPTTRYMTRRIVIPGAGTSGADFVGTVANISGQSIILNATASTAVSGVTAKLWPVRRHTATAGATATYTIPAGSSSVGLVAARASNGGLATVSIDNDLTAANFLPTAQQVVDLGNFPSTILTTNGGTIAPTTRVIDFYNFEEIYSTWIAIASGLSTGTAHTLVLNVTGIKRAAAAAARVFVAGFGYGTPTTTPATAGALVFIGNRVGTHFPTHELAIDHLPTGGTTKAFVGGNNHGYEYATAAPALTVDGAVVNLTDGASVNVAGSAKVVIASDLYHPQRTDLPTFNVLRTYRLGAGGLTVNQILTAKIATVVDSGYLAMFSVANTLDRAQVDGGEIVINLQDYVTNPDGTYTGKGKNTGAAWWKNGGETVAAIIIPAAQQMTGNWSEAQVMASVRIMQGTKASKFYARRTGSVAVGDKWAGEATYIVGRLPDGAANYFPAS